MDTIWVLFRKAMLMRFSHMSEILLTIGGRVTQSSASLPRDPLFIFCFFLSSIRRVQSHAQHDRVSFLPEYSWPPRINAPHSETMMGFVLPKQTQDQSRVILRALISCRAPVIPSRRGVFPFFYLFHPRRRRSRVEPLLTHDEIFVLYS